MHSPESRQEMACYNYVTSREKRAPLYNVFLDSIAALSEEKGGLRSVRLAREALMTINRGAKKSHPFKKGGFSTNNNRSYYEMSDSNINDD